MHNGQHHLWFGGLYRDDDDARVKHNNEAGAPRTLFPADFGFQVGGAQSLPPSVRFFPPIAPALPVEPQVSDEDVSPRWNTSQVEHDAPCWREFRECDTTTATTAAAAVPVAAPWATCELQEVSAELMLRTLSVLGQEAARMHWEALRWDSLQQSDVVRSYMTRQRREKITELFKQRMNSLAMLGTPKAGCVFFYPKDAKTGADLGVWIIADPATGFAPAKNVADLSYTPPHCKADWEESGPRKKEGRTFRSDGFRAWISHDCPNYVFISPETLGRTAKRRATAAVAPAAAITHLSPDWHKYNPLANTGEVYANAAVVPSLDDLHLPDIMQIPSFLLESPV